MRRLLTVLAFAVLLYLVWRLWKPFVNPPKREVPKDKANLYFFHTDWCGHCQKAMPEWEKLEAGPTTFGNTTVSFVRVNADKDRPTTDLYKVDSYPTIKLETSSALYDYSGARTQEALTKFLRETFGKEA
jgi:thioredoxin-like negative regulator of GroEL